MNSNEYELYKKTKFLTCKTRGDAVTFLNVKFS